MEDYQHIKVTVTESMATVTLNRPPYNILNIEMMEELISSFYYIAAQPTVRVVLINAEGKAFSSGVDVREHTGELAEKMISTFNDLFRALWGFKAITISAVDGLALGGGCELATGCDIVLASENAKLGQPEISVGVIPPMAVAVFPDLIGRNRAIEWLLTGNIYSASDAFSVGLVNRVFQPETFRENVAEYCSQFTRQSAVVIAIGKKVIDATYWKSARDGMAYADKIYLEELMKTEDAHEGIAAFLEKRKPIWKHK